jgi:hypothetical protein
MNKAKLFLTMFFIVDATAKSQKKRRKNNANAPESSGQRIFDAGVNFGKSFENGTGISALLCNQPNSRLWTPSLPPLP